jgi:hypothetical protein
MSAARRRDYRCGRRSGLAGLCGRSGALLGRRCRCIANSREYREGGSRPRLNVPQTLCMASPLSGHAPHFRVHSRGERKDIGWLVWTVWRSPFAIANLRWRWSVIVCTRSVKSRGSGRM